MSEIPNPKKEQLEQLLRDVQSARGAVPSLRPVAAEIGGAGSWQGSSADRAHQNSYAPTADDLVRYLDRLEDAVRDAIALTPDSLPGGA